MPLPAWESPRAMCGRPPCPWGYHRFKHHLYRAPVRRDYSPCLNSFLHRHPARLHCYLDLYAQHDNSIQRPHVCGTGREVGQRAQNLLLSSVLSRPVRKRLAFCLGADGTGAAKTSLPFFPVGRFLKIAARAEVFLSLVGVFVRVPGPLSVTGHVARDRHSVRDPRAWPSTTGGFSE